MSTCLLKPHQDEFLHGIAQLIRQVLVQQDLALQRHGANGAHAALPQEDLIDEVEDAKEARDHLRQHLLDGSPGLLRLVSEDGDVLHHSSALANGEVRHQGRRAVRRKEDQELRAVAHQLLIEVPAAQLAVAVGERLVKLEADVVGTIDLSDGHEPPRPAQREDRARSVCVTHLDQGLCCDRNCVASKELLRDVANGVLAIAADFPCPEGSGLGQAEDALLVDG